MKNRVSLALMEQLVMVLVFGLAAAVCLGIFARADQISRETQRRDEAVLLAQNGAEVLKSSAGDMEKTADILGGEMTENGLTVASGAFLMIVERTDSGVPGLGRAWVGVYWEEELLFSLETGWQEVGK